MLADLAATAHKAPSDVPHADAIASNERPVANHRAQMRALRLRAEELRVTADQFNDSSAQESRG